jgi:hypothetical protein
VYTELPFCSLKTKRKPLQVVELRGFLSPIMCGDFRAVRWVGAKSVSGKKDWIQCSIPDFSSSIQYSLILPSFFEEQKSGIEH